MSTKNLTVGVVIVCALIIGGYFIAKQPGQDLEKPSQASITQNSNNKASKKPSQPRFNGEKGENLTLTDNKIDTDNKIELETATFKGNEANFYNVELQSGKIVYFFVVKDKKGNYRAAANACQVCFDERKGFHQDGDYMVCNTCRSKYPLSKIATEKGGCNPGPINPNLEVQGSKIIIEQADLEEVAFFF